MNSVSINFDSKIPYIFQLHPVRTSLITLVAVGCIALFVAALVSRFVCAIGLNTTAAFVMSVPGIIVAFHLLRKQTIAHLHALVRNPSTTPQQFEVALHHHSTNLWTQVNGNSCLDVVVENVRRDLLPILLRNEEIKPFFVCHGITSALERERPELALKYLRCGSSLMKNLYAQLVCGGDLRILKKIVNWSKPHFDPEGKRVFLADVLHFLEVAQRSDGKRYLTFETLAKVVEESLSSFTISLGNTSELTILLLQWKLFEYMLREDRLGQAVLECLGITIDPLQAYDVYIYRQLAKEKKARMDLKLEEANNKIDEKDDKPGGKLARLLSGSIYLSSTILPDDPEKDTFLRIFNENIDAMAPEEQIRCEDLLRSFHDAALEELSSAVASHIPVVDIVNRNIGSFFGLAPTFSFAPVYSCARFDQLIERRLALNSLFSHT